PGGRSVESSRGLRAGSMPRRAAPERGPRFDSIACTYTLGWYRLDSRIRGGFPVSLLRSVPRIAAISGDKPGSPKGGHSMSRQYFDDAYRGSPPQNYE